MISAIMRDLFVNAGEVILGETMVCRHSPKALAFPCLITEMCEAAGVPDIIKRGHAKGCVSEGELKKVEASADYYTGLF